MELKTRMKELRALRNIKQTELASILNVSQGTIANWESGKRSPDCDMIVKLASVFAVSVDYLLGNDDNVEILLSPKQEEQKEMPPNSEEQAAIIERIKKLNPEQIEQASKFVEFLISQRENHID